MYGNQVYLKIVVFLVSLVALASLKSPWCLDLLTLHKKVNNLVLDAENVTDRQTDGRIETDITAAYAALHYVTLLKYALSSPRGILLAWL